MQHNLTIRDYGEADYGILKTMMLGLVQDDNDDHGYEMSESQILQTVQRSVSHPEQLQIKIFAIENAVAGYALLTFYWSNEHGGIVVLLDELYILPNFRGRRIGTQFIEQLAENKAYAAIRLEVFKKNDKALQLYKRLGFEIVERHFMDKGVR